MLNDIVEAQALDNYRLRLRFEDGAEGVIDVAKLVSFTGVFAELRDRRTFAAVRVEPELGTVVWPGGGRSRPGRALFAGGRRTTACVPSDPQETPNALTFPPPARDETAALTEEIAKIEKKIDKRVAALYGL